MITCQYCHATTQQDHVGKLKSGPNAGLDVYRCDHCNQLYVVGWKSSGDSDSAPRIDSIDDVNRSDSPPITVTPSQTGRLQRASQWVVDASSVFVLTWLAFIKNVTALVVQPIQAGNAAEVAAKLEGAFPAQRDVDSDARTNDSALTFSKWGWLPEIVLIQSLGLLIISWSFVESRTAATSAQTFWWIGLAVMLIPVTVRLASVDAARRERIGLVLSLGMALYLVKVMHSPFAFTFPDELSHMRNVLEILQNGRLFHDNPIQPVTALYPGLPNVTSTLSALSGLSIFDAGIWVVGIARLILFLGLYLLFEQVSGSARVAGLATVLYMANPNFLYWTAEYAYEPLALPVLVFVLLAVAKREMVADRTQVGAWTVAALLGSLTVVITHHMSSYILVVLLLAITFLCIVYSRGRYWGPWPVALVAGFTTAIWLIFIANLTIKYLSPVLSGAVESLFQMVVEEEAGRELFKSTTLTTESPTPAWEQFVAMGSVVLITLGLPLGVLEIVRRHRGKVLAILLAAVALTYLPMQVLRFTKAGWETANRSSEFLFIGIAFVLALGIVRFWLSNWTGPRSRMLLGVLSVALFFGGLIAGWPPRARMARPYLVSAAGEHVVRPQLVTAAEWMLVHLGPDNRIAASKADAKVFGAYGQYPFTDNGPIKNLFLSDAFGHSEQTTLLKRDIQYVVSDRKVVSWDHMIGYYFYSQYSNRPSDLRLVESPISEKLDGLRGIPRFFDSGDIVIYGTELYLQAYIPAEAAASAQPNNNEGGTP